MPADDQALFDEGKCYVSCGPLTTAQIMTLAMWRRRVLESNPSADVTPQGLLSYSDCYGCYTGNTFDLMELALMNLEIESGPTDKAVEFANVSSTGMVNSWATGTEHVHTIAIRLTSGYVIAAFQLFDGAFGTIVSCTFNGTPMVQLGTKQLDTTENRVVFFGLALGNISAGNYVLVPTAGGAIIDKLVLGCMTFSGVNQLNPTALFVAGDNGGSEATSAQLTLSSAAGDLIAGCLLGEAGFAATPTGFNQVETWNSDPAGIGNGGYQPGISGIFSWSFADQLYVIAAIRINQE